MHRIRVRGLGFRGQGAEGGVQKIGISKNIFCLFFVFCFLYSLFSTLSPVFCYAQDPKEQEALFVAKKAFDDGFFDVSLNLFERFLTDYPDSSSLQESYYWLAESYFKENDFSKAKVYYQKVINNFSHSSYIPASFYSLGWCLFQEQDFKGAIEYFKKVGEKYHNQPFSNDASFKIIECLYNLKEFPALKERGCDYLKNNAKDKQRAAYLHFYIAEADYYLNNFKEAIGGYSQSLLNTTDERITALCRLGLGWSYLKQKEYKAAEENFSLSQTGNLDNLSSGILLLGKAILKQESGNFEAAINIYKELLEASYDKTVSIQAYLGLAGAFYNIGDYIQAKSMYQEALAKAPLDSAQEGIDKLHYGLAWTFLKQGEFKEAIDEFQKVAKLSEEKEVKVSALCQIGDAYLDFGDFNKAIEVYESISKNYPDSPYKDYVQYKLGFSLLKIANYNAAIIIFKSFKTNFPESKLLDDASYALGLAYFQKQYYNLSKETFDKFQIEFQASNLKAQALYLQGMSLYNLMKFAEAIEVFKSIIKLYAQDTELFQKCEYNIADCFYKLGDEKEALARFTALRAKYPSSNSTSEIIWWLGEYYYRHNQQDIARRYFLTLTQDFPKSSLIMDAYYALGVSFSGESKYDEAIHNFKKVAESGKSDLAVNANINIADLYIRQENYNLALKTYQDTVKTYPNFEYLIYPKIAEIHYKRADYEQAIQFLDKALNGVPIKEKPHIQFKIAESRQAQGKSLEAIEEYLKIPSFYPEDADLAVKSFLRAGLIYENNEDFKQALNIYKKIASMNVEEAKYALERIEWINTHGK